MRATTSRRRVAHAIAATTARSKAWSATGATTILRRDGRRRPATRAGRAGAALARGLLVRYGICLAVLFRGCSCDSGPWTARAAAAAGHCGGMRGGRTLDRTHALRPRRGVRRLREREGSTAIARSMTEPRWLASVHVDAAAIPPDLQATHSIDGVEATTPTIVTLPCGQAIWNRPGADP
jgi:hypothetical protein